MIYNNKAQKSKKKKTVTDTLEIFKKYSSARDTWAKEAKEDKEFRLGKQWTKEQVDTLEARGQAPIVVNRIHPAVETAKAMITANRPSFRVSPREDSDKKIANVISSLLSYMYDISDGRTVIRQAIDDYYTMGLGYINIYQDPMKDMGKGEVCIHDVDPLDVYVDPASRNRFFDDAENIIVSRLFTKEQAMKLWPMYESKIKNASGEEDHNAPETGRHYDGTIQFPEDVERLDKTEYVRGYERYYKVNVEEYRIYESFSGKEDLMNDEEYEKYVKTPVYIVEKRIFKDREKAMQFYQTLELQRQMEMEKQMMQSEAEMKQLGYGPEAELPEPEVPKVHVEEADIGFLISQNLVEVVKTLVTKVKQCVIIGETELYSRVLPIENYPIVPFCNVHTRTPYPASDVRLVKGLQEYINKTRSLIIAHATTSTNTKILVPEGSVDMADFEQKWAQPGVAIQYDPTDGAPMPIQPSPLPNELYNNEMTAKNDIDHQLGLYEMMQGNASAAPQTYKATIALDEFGQRKIKSKLADIEASLTRVAQLAIPLMQQLYTTRKVFRVVQPNNSLNEYVINQKLVDDKTEEIKIFNDITIGKYDVVVVAGSTLPTNRYAELEFYKDAFQMGLIDRQEVLKKTEIFDAEGVQERMDMIAKLKGALEQAQGEIKKLQGDIQTRDREAVNLRKKAEVEKFKSGLDKIKNKSEAAGSLFDSRLDDTLSLVKNKITTDIQRAGQPSEKEAPKKKKTKKKK